MQEYTRGTGLQPCKGYVEYSTVVHESTTKNVVTKVAQMGKGEDDGEKDRIISNWLDRHFVWVFIYLVN